MKILALHLGGTISCAEENGVLTPSADIKNEFKTIKYEFDGIDFDHKSAKPFLSEYLNGTRISAIIKEIKKAVQSKKYGGIIFTHGSDTIAYTACALAYALGSSTIPIVGVCSELPISNPSSSGKANLRAATALIVSGNERGVFAVYKTSDSEVKVFRATRLLRHKAYETELSCVGEPYGKVLLSAPVNAILTLRARFSRYFTSLSHPSTVAAFFAMLAE